MSERLSHALRREVRERQDYRCALCGEQHLPGENGACISAHHITPRSKGGPDAVDNLVGLCRGENTNNCHDNVDYLTLEHNIPFETIMEAGLEYWLEEYPKPEPRWVMRRQQAQQWLPQEGRPLYPTSSPGDD